MRIKYLIFTSLLLLSSGSRKLVLFLLFFGLFPFLQPLMLYIGTYLDVYQLLFSDSDGSSEKSPVILNA